MKQRLLLILACLLAMAVPAGAETHYKPHIATGFHAGYDMSKVTFSPSVKQKFVGGYCAGVSLSYQEERLVGVLAEFNFVQRGWAENFEEEPLSYSRTLNYIAIPIMTHINFGTSRFKCFFNLGPEFSYMIAESTSANFDYNNPTSAENWPSSSRMTEQLITPVHTKFDYGICASFGCEFWLTPRRSVYLEGRYYYGLGNIFPSTKADTFSASRNMTISITLGYNFRLY